jgi:hypothetical protein
MKTRKRKPKGKSSTPVKRRRKSHKKKQTKLWGLERLTFPKAIQHVLDMDYIAELNDDEKRWLSEFNASYYGNTFPSKHKSGRKTNMFDKAGIPRKELYDQTNARNRDIFSKRYKFNETFQGIAVPESYSEFTSPENAILDAIDKEGIIKKFREDAAKAQTERAFIDKLTSVVFDTED